MYYNDEEQAAYEAEMYAQAKAYLIHQERFQLLSIEIVLDMIRNGYSDKSGKTIVEFLNEERKKYEHLNQTDL